MRTLRLAEFPILLWPPASSGDQTAARPLPCVEAPDACPFCSPIPTSIGPYASVSFSVVLGVGADGPERGGDTRRTPRAGPSSRRTGPCPPEESSRPHDSPCRRPFLHAFNKHCAQEWGDAATPSGPHTAPGLRDANPSDCPVSWSLSLASEVLRRLLSLLQTAGRGRGGPAEPSPRGRGCPPRSAQHSAETELAAVPGRPASLPLAAASWLVPLLFL